MHCADCLLNKLLKPRNIINFAFSARGLILLISFLCLPFCQRFTYCHLSWSHVCMSDPSDQATRESMLTAINASNYSSVNPKQQVVRIFIPFIMHQQRTIKLFAGAQLGLGHIVHITYMT